MYETLRVLLLKRRANIENDKAEVPPHSTGGADDSKQMVIGKKAAKH